MSLPFYIYNKLEKTQTIKEKKYDTKRDYMKLANRSDTLKKIDDLIFKEVLSQEDAENLRKYIDLISFMNIVLFSLTLDVMLNVGDNITREEFESQCESIIEDKQFESKVEHLGITDSKMKKMAIKEMGLYFSKIKTM